MFATDQKVRMPEKAQALPGRAEKMAVPGEHFVLKTPLVPPFPKEMREIFVGMGCFWGAERKFWQTDGVYSTSVGYQGGFTPNPTYKEVCSGLTGHTEVVRVVFDPKKVSEAQLLQIFWENHDPTQGMRQGGDVGTQYRSAIYCIDDAQVAAAQASKDAYAALLKKAGFTPITTEVLRAPEYFYAEEYHQQYLAKNPDGYCGLGGTGVACPVGVFATRAATGP